MRNPAGRSVAGLTLAGVLLLAVSGCGGQKTKVRGVVTLDGKPLGKAMVVFLPIGGHGQQAHGITESDGSFQLETLTPDDGAWPGDYKVTVQKYEVDASMKEIDPADPKANEKMYLAAAKANAKPKKYLVPEVYRNPEKTPLRWNIPGDNNKTLELTSTAK